jgi:hypothetical protein
MDCTTKQQQFVCCTVIYDINKQQTFSYGPDDTLLLLLLIWQPLMF